MALAVTENILHLIPIALIIYTAGLNLLQDTRVTTAELEFPLHLSNGTFKLKSDSDALEICNQLPGVGNGS